jgi:hypothetical protein
MFNTCQQHGQNIILVYDGYGGCPICKAMKKQEEELDAFRKESTEHKAEIRRLNDALRQATNIVK